MVEYIKMTFISYYLSSTGAIYEQFVSHTIRMAYQSSASLSRSYVYPGEFLMHRIWRSSVDVEWEAEAVVASGINQGAKIKTGGHFTKDMDK